MTVDLQGWRDRNHLTQVEAASMLGVSQPYLSLLEKGARPLTRELRRRLKVVRRSKERPLGDDRLRAQLSALGYPGFAHLAAARQSAEPNTLLFEALSTPDLDARVTEALPWLVWQFAPQLNWPWLVRQAKLRDLQNRLGFLVDMGTVLRGGLPKVPPMAEAKADLEKARLLQEATFCWDSMPAATRDWTRANRSPAATHWNVVSRMRPEDLAYE